MSSELKETDYYPEICLKMLKYLKDCMGGGCKFACSIKTSLPEMVNDIYAQLGEVGNEIYYPQLKVDIMIGVKFPNAKISLLLLEVKLGSTLSLMNFSQLVGYMQVAKHIEVGLLVLVNKGVKGSPLSSDFASIINVRQLPADWEVLLSKTNEHYNFKTGICMYTPSNGIDWVDSNICSGISSWGNLKDSLT